MSTPEPEPLCDLQIIQADYRLVSYEGREPDHYFHVRVTPHNQEVQFDVLLNNGELFAAELEVLAAIIRSRVIRARIIAQELR